jgi:hypothetical protein
MGESNELIEVALTVAIALAVGFTGASFGRSSPATQSSCGATQTQILIDRVLHALVPSEQEISSPLRNHVEI